MVLKVRPKYILVDPHIRQEKFLKGEEFSFGFLLSLHQWREKEDFNTFLSSSRTSNQFQDLMASSMTAAVTTTGSSLENPLSSLSSGYFSDSPIPGNFKKSLVTDQEIVQIPLEQEHDDEPNILAAKPFVAAASSQPQKSSLTAQQNLSSNGSLIEGQGYSHLEWSASIPFNVAEEPDDVQGEHTGWLKNVVI